MTRDDEDENPWAFQFLLGSQAELDADLKAFEAAEEAEKRPRSSLRPSWRQPRRRKFSASMGICGDAPRIIPSPLSMPRSTEIARFYEALRRRDPPL